MLDADAINENETMVSIFLGAQMDGQVIPIADAKVLPDDMHYGKGEWTQDILLIPFTGERNRSVIKCQFGMSIKLRIENVVSSFEFLLLL